MSVSAKYIEVAADVRYWEDARINGVEDTDGSLIPARVNHLWCPVIRLEDGQVMDWPEGTTANVHFKVCDAGEYWLLDENRQRVAKWAGFYVPNDFLCHGDQGYGDYIILNINESGKINAYRAPKIEMMCVCDDDEQDECEEQSLWRPLSLSVQNKL